jgi:hypothetical protein
MAHCPYDRLDDLEDVLDVIRSWPGLKEPKPGTFYLGGAGFLHFHIQEVRRWADIRDGKDWGPPVQVPLHIAARDKQKFLRTAERRLHATLRARRRGA